MVNPIIISFLTILCLISCSHKPIYYEYNGTTITRIDQSGKIKFYYGRYKEIENQRPYVKVEYSGFNSGVDAFLLFHKEGKVEIIDSGGGYFTESDTGNKLLFMKEYENPVLDSIIKSYQGNYANLYRISDVLKLEKVYNLKNNSMVKAEYPSE